MLLKVWSADQKHQQHLGTSEKSQFFAQTRLLGSETLGAGPAVQTSPPGASDACLHVRTTALKEHFHESPVSVDFIGSWVNKFPTEMTHNHNFRLNEREVVKVSMMQTKGSFLATNDQELDCDVLQLEYVGGISMLIVVPHKLSGMKTLETQLTPQVVERWQKSMTNRYFRLSVLLISRIPREPGNTSTLIILRKMEKYARIPKNCLTGPLY